MSGKSSIGSDMTEVISELAPRPGTPSTGSQASSQVPPSPSGSMTYLQRKASKDSMERSITTDSGHGESAAQIIRDLKASNAALSAKTTKMESEFMDEINKTSVAFQEVKLRLEEEIRKKDNQIATGQALPNDTGMLGKLREENASQKDIISNLKTQLFQLQHDVEEVEFEKRDEVDKWSAEKQELIRELETLRQQVKGTGDRSNREVRAPVSPDNSTSSEVMESWKRLEEMQWALEHSKDRLQETQSTLARVENESKRKSKEHEHELAKWKATHIEDKEEWSKKERMLLDKIKELEEDSLRVEETRSQLKERDEEIDSLQNEIAKYEHQVDALTSDRDNAKPDPSNRDRYRRAHAAEVQRLKRELDARNREVAEKDKALNEKLSELDVQLENCRMMELKLLQAGGKVASEEGGRHFQYLERQLQQGRDTARDLQDELRAQKSLHQEEVNQLREEIGALTMSRREMESGISQAKTERDEALKLLQGVGDGSLSEKRIRDIVASSTNERAQLETSYESRLNTIKIEKNSENERVESALEGETHETNTESSAVVRKLKAKIKHLEGKSAGLQRTKKQLREAQVALVALDDEKNRMEESYSKRIEALDKGTGLLDRPHQARPAVVEASVVDGAGRMELKAEVERLNVELEEKKTSLNSLIELANQRSGENVDEVLYREFVSARTTEKKLSKQLEVLQQAAEDKERELKEKLKDRNTTIATLVKSSVAEEQKFNQLKSELDSLKARVATGKTADTSDAVSLARDANRIEELQRMVDMYKANESKRNEEMKSLKTKLLAAEVELSRSRGSVRQLEGNDTTADIQEKLQERDTAIATLVKQSMSQEALVLTLRSKVKSLEAKKGSSTSELEAALGELSQLRKENEIFAGQIVDQDEEMVAIRTDLSGRDAQVTALSLELGSLRSQTNTHQIELGRVEGLRAELDELQEANSTQREELRVIRRQLREAKAEVDRVDDLKLELAEARQALDEYRLKVGESTRGDDSLKRELDDAITARIEDQERAGKELASLRREQDSLLSSLHAKVEAREEEIESLKMDLDASEDRVRSLEAEVDNLHRDLEEHAAMAVDEVAMTDELHKLKEERAVLIKDVEDLNKELAAFQDDRNDIEELKERENSRLSAEQGIIDAYERKLSLLKLDKDVTIDGLRKELTEEKGRNTEDLEDLVDRIKDLEMENKDLKDELEAKLELKNTKIYALEQTLGAQEQLVDNMKTEMDQLQTSMMRHSVTRRAEIEEMQQEVVEKTAEMTLKDREITAVKMELEESRLANSLEISKLKDRITSMEKSPETSTTTMDHQPDTRLSDVKERLEQVKWRNTQLHEDNAKLRARLEKSEAVSKDTKNDQVQVLSLQEEIEALRKQVKVLKDEQAAVHARRTSTRPPMVERPASTTRQRAPSLEPRQRGRTAQSGSPRRSATPPASPGRLRFLKRRSRSKDFEIEDAPTADEESISSGSKPKF